MDQDAKTVADYMEMVKRRKWSLILPTAIIFIISLIAALVWPPTYRSTSTILIEEQEIPKEYVMTTVTSYAEQRLQSLNQRIMSTTRLLEVVNRFNLYLDLRKRLTIEEVIEMMRKDIKFETISADVLDRRKGGAPAATTIAFTVSYDGKNPGVVQQVANVLASLYLEENLRVREAQTEGATKFLDEEATGLRKQLVESDMKISAFKTKHQGELPELVQLNLQTLERIERDIDMQNDQLRNLKEREGSLQVQLASIPTDAANQDKTLMKELKAKLVQLQSKYSDKYPDIGKTKSEIAELEKRLAAAPKGDTDNTKKSPSPFDQPDNPAYVTLASQLSSTQSDIESTKKQIGELQRKRDDYRKRMELSPRVEEGYKALMTERNNTQLKYDEMMKKSMEARVAQGMEKGQMGEKFTLIDPARLPEKPVKPKIPVIILLGLFLGIGAGVGTTALKEYSDQSVRNEQSLAALTTLPVLSTIPEIITEKDRIRVRARRKIAIISTAGAVVLAIILFHFLVMDLNVLWARVSRRYL
jgi:polysaccharide chain length determinant protein (PEP-CTERM system associated)